MKIGDLIKEQYGGSILRKSALSIRDGAGVLEKVLGGRQYKTVLEIGTYRGVSAAEMSQYCEKVITIDLIDGKLEGNGEAVDREGFWRGLGVNNIELHLVKDNADKARLIEGLEFDFAFIDGAHDATVALDFEMVKKCGAVLFHDYCKRNKPGAPNYVYDFVSSLKGSVEVYDIFGFWRPE